jgi:hypothetical protein
MRGLNRECSVSFLQFSKNKGRLSKDDGFHGLGAMIKLPFNPTALTVAENDKLEKES